MAAAVDLVAERGLGDLTHRAVAARMGVPFASVSYHYPLIQDLRAATCEHAARTLRIAMSAAERRAEPDAGRRARVVGEFCAALLRHRRASVVVAHELLVAAVHDESLRPVSLRFVDHAAGLLAPWTDGEVAARVAVSAVLGAALVALVERAHDEHQPADVLARVLEGFVRT